MGVATAFGDIMPSEVIAIGSDLSKVDVRRARADKGGTEIPGTVGIGLRPASVWTDPTCLGGGDD